jgi:diguanylate cyclase (GGDEF)-like protein
LQFVSEIVDITARKAQQELDQLQASTDPLTGLLNRRGFDAAVEAALAPDERSPGIGILAIDLDRFKPVNDKFGHAAGDALLVEAGHRLAATVRSIDSVARLGGDEFAVLLTACSHKETEAAAARVVDALAAPYMIDNHEIIVSASVGAIFTAAAITDFAKLLRQADEELYRAKDGGRGCWRLSGIAA